MKITTLIENSGSEGLTPEWGLSLLIEYRGGRYLLDGGATGRFADNAKALGVRLEDVDAAILSHAHYDHSGGLETFAQLNDHAPIYLQAAAEENCYSRHGLIRVYIGLQKGMIQRLDGRIVRVEGDCTLAPGVTLISHKQPDMAARGRRAGMYLRQGHAFRPDDFAHEQSLVFELTSGLVILSSCSHGGLDAILDEVRRAFPGKPVRAMVGGFHLVHTPPRAVRALADRLNDMGAPELYTGHCTGERATEILESRLPGKVHRMRTGSVFSLEDQ